MNKQAFLSMLRSRLSGLPKEDMERSVEYYSEIIDDRMEEGLSEEEAVGAVGSMDEIVSQIVMDTPLPKLVKEKVKPKHTLKAWEIVLLLVGSPVWLPLLAAAVILVLTAYVVLWTFVLVLYALVVSLAACALSGIFGSFLYIPTGKIAPGVLLFGGGLVCAGFAILSFFGVNQAAKGILLISKKILFAIKRCFIRKENAE